MEATVTGSEDLDKDPLYDDAVKFLTGKSEGSISQLQRHFRIGYNRAARLIEALENDGAISTPAYNGIRKVIGVVA
ncbi:DNA translocase FtsK [Pectobacterium parmentieri]|uniref:DNA translocase FtsK n=1 Tax=Pectobacterium parmentieri TaxID=1905730 RepID=UPI00217E97A1|nr:DNA translocase FtsK [Pectobacterium parmentieri]